MASRANSSWSASARLWSTAATLGIVSLTVTLFVGLTSLLGDNYRIDPPLLHPFRPPTRDEAVVAYPAEYALKSSDYNDVVFLGDSTCRCSIDPAEFQSASGLSAYNLGSMGALGVGSYEVILQVYLKHHPKPRAVVLAVTPDDLDVELSEKPGGWPHLFRWSYGPGRDAIRLPSDLESLEFFSRRGVQIVCERWADALAGRRFDPRVQLLVGGGNYTYLTLERKVRQSRGYWALAGKHWPGGTEPPNKSTFAVARQWDAGFGAIAEIAEDAGVLLIIRLVPLVDTVTTDYEPVRSWLSNFRHEHPGATVLRPEIPLYDAELCWDYQHLNGDGVRKFSRSVAKDVSILLSRRSHKVTLIRDQLNRTKFLRSPF
jgi:hypothetical protein